MTLSYSVTFQKLKCFVFGLFLFTFQNSPGADATVFAAISLSDALKEIAVAYEKLSEDRIYMNFGASSTLARQIEEGAPADIFFAADEARMNALETKGLIQKETRRNRLSNLLVIVVPSETGV